MATTRQVMAYINQSDKDAKDGKRRHLTAPKGKFRVIGVDTFEGPRADYLIDDFKKLQHAMSDREAFQVIHNLLEEVEDERIDRLMDFKFEQR